MLMVQSSVAGGGGKLQGPPPVPPRPPHSAVAQALARTRRAVTDSRSGKYRVAPKDQPRSRTLERGTAPPAPAPAARQSGLARVKSFIRDVISDRGSSSDERRSSGHSSRRSSNDSTTAPPPLAFGIRKSNESLHTKTNKTESLNSKAVKTCKQILVRSLSTTSKSDQDAKCKVTKSSSFAEKTLPLRKAPPPPLSPKPKLRPMKPLPLNNTTLERRKTKPKSPELSLYSSPVDARSPATPQPEAPYATVEEVQDFDDRLRDSPSKQVADCPATQERDDVNKNNNSLERKTSRVTEMLISEILASRNNNKDEANAVIDKGKCPENVARGPAPSAVSVCSGKSSPESELTKDMNNHEMLIYELQTMRSQSNVPEQINNKVTDLGNYEIVMNNNTDVDSYECVNNNTDVDNYECVVNNNTDVDNYEAVEKQCDSEDSEQLYALSSATSGADADDSDQAYAYILDDDLKSRLRKQYRTLSASSMSLSGLPPLPKSLSGFVEPPPPADTPRPNPGAEPSHLDQQLVYLKQEMANLRQLDLSLLSELWSLSEAMTSWRRQLERTPRRKAPPPPPPPPPHYHRT